MNDKMKQYIDKLGLPRLIIISFFIILLIAAFVLRLNVPALLGDAVRRWGMYVILVLAMVPGVQSGIGLNFGISLGIVAGLLSSTLVIELGIANPWLALLIAMVLGAGVAALIGIAYGVLLNRVKGSEMTVSTYVGFSVIALMNIVWLTVPFKNGELIWPIGNQGLRNTINLEGYFGNILNNFLGFSIGDFYFPTGLVLFSLLMCYLVYLFMKSRLGISMSAAGSSQMFARSSGINVDRMRILGTAISTALAAVGIIMYSQSYGFIQLYNAPLMMGFHCVAAVLIGGATVSRANISHVLIGTFLFQGILAVALPVINTVMPESNLPDVIRIIISNGVILYALSKTKEGRNV